MKRNWIIWTFAAMLLSGAVVAQDDGGKIKVEITKEIDGEKKTFKGEYNSMEEMKADPNYREFAGDEESFNFWFDDDMDEDVFLHLDQFGDQNHAFRYFHGDDRDGDHNFFFKHFDDDSMSGFFNFHLDDMDLDDFKERMSEMGKEMELLMERLHDEDGKRSIQVFGIKHVKIDEVEDEFGKKGKVDESNRLELDDLAFYPNPSSNGRFKVRFTVEEENELSIKVSNLEGKEVFSRYFERFGGTYSEVIDLSGQNEGIYLLEISQRKKRLTKKVIIN